MKFRNEIVESQTLKFAQTAAERSQRGLPIISLGLGEPDFNVPDQIVEATIDVLQTTKSGYSDPMGIPSLREKISLKLEAENGIHCGASNIVVTAGAKQAFQLVCMAVLEPGDEVIVINPSFVSFIPQIYIAEPECEVRVIDVNKIDFSIDINMLRSIISSKTKLLILNTPNNPAGYMIDKIELALLFELSLENNFYIISDEVYEKLVFSANLHMSIGSFESVPNRVITINGFSKSHAMTGWRLGYACFPAELRNKILRLQQHINTNTCTFIQRAVDKAFNTSIEYLKNYNQELKERSQMITQIFSNITGITLIPPVAGFFCFINISGLGIDSNTFCSRLIEETGVATTPGLAFGNNWDDHVRISYATSKEILEEGCKLMEAFIIKLKSPS